MHTGSPPLRSVPDMVLVPPPAPPSSPAPSPPPPPLSPGGGAGGGPPSPRGPAPVTMRRSAASATRHLRHLDPWRRHSWEPGALPPGPGRDLEAPCNADNRSVSLENLDPEEMEKVLGSTLGAGRRSRGLLPPQEGSLSSLTEEDATMDPQLYARMELGWSSSAPSLNVDPSTASDRSRRRPRPRSHCYETLPQLGGSTQSVDSDLGGDSEDGKGDSEDSPLVRTFSFLRKMAGRASHKNKEKERMREREKEAREREARYSNGHLYTSLTVSGTTLCTACNKSITAKEALSCPTCNVTIHNRCRDTLPNCNKMKQRQHKLALMRNNSTLQNVTLRNKHPVMRERPSSAIYHSDNLRQSLLGSRRGRSSLSLSKSVSTNNIAGHLNEDSPLGLRRILSQSTDSLNVRNRAMSMESLNDEGEMYYVSMLEELEIEPRDFEVDSWSMAVDSDYLQTHRKDVIKRQDVIFELIQTELHHMRTLRIMERVFRQGMLEEVHVEPATVHAIFPCLDRLTALHGRFLATLLQRRTHSLQPGSTYNFTIDQLGDVLIEQFSGQCADEMRKTYAEFCNRHPKAVKQYKELLARDKRFQCFIRRLSRGHLLRRHGVPECILLVTQRITKYPVIIQRILDNTKDDEEEASSVAQALSLVRELLTSVDQQVVDLEKSQRLQEIQARLDPRAETKVRDGSLFRPGELNRRSLIHEGSLLWKTPGSRLKDLQVLLMTDIMVFLQEKDQRYIFPCLDKPAVLSLQHLMVRDIASQDRGLFLISDSSPPEMYEVHASSKDDKNQWMRVIQHTVSNCPSREDFPLIETEDKALLRRLKGDIQQKDREVLELLQERVNLFSDLVEVTGGHEVTLPPNTRNLFRADVAQAPRAERLLLDAIAEVDRLSNLLLGANLEIPLPCTTNSNLNHTGALAINGQEVLVNGTHVSPGVKDHSGSRDKTPSEEISQRLMNVSAHLHALQGVVVKQDSIVELCLHPEAASAQQPPPMNRCLRRSLSRDTAEQQQQQQGGPGSPLGELNLLQRQHSLLQEELTRLRGADGRLKDSERARAHLERQVRDMRAGGGGAAGEHSSERNELGHGADSQLASQDSIDQSDGLQDCSDGEVDMTSDEDDDDGKESPRSESPRDLQDIPEESENGAEQQRHATVSHC